MIQPDPLLSFGEDTPVAEEIVKTGRVVLLDLPRLYTYIYHGNNTFGHNHWEEHWHAATAKYEDERYNRKLAEIKSLL